MPSLRPGEDLRGLTILALHEDGFGDTLQFLRYLPLLADLGARVIACVPPVAGPVDADGARRGRCGDNLACSRMISSVQCSVCRGFLARRWPFDPAGSCS